MIKDYHTPRGGNMTFGDDFGADREPLGIKMTEPNRLPNNCQRARDGAAERIDMATTEILNALAGNEPEKRLYKALFLLSEASRELERLGAKTIVREL